MGRMWEGIGKSGGKGKCNQDILYEKSIFDKIKINK